MKTLAVSTPQSAFDLKTEDVLASLIDAVDLADDELEQVTGSWCGCGGWGGWGSGFGWGGSWGPGFGWGGFHRSFAFSSFSGAFGGRHFF